MRNAPELPIGTDELLRFRQLPLLAVADVVTVGGSDQADRIDLTAQGGAIDVAGLQVEDRIIGGETRDHLEVNTADGNDRVNVDPSVSPIIGVAVDLGLGRV